MSDRLKKETYKKDHIKTMVDYSSKLAELYADKFGADYHMVTSHFLDKESQERYHPGISKMALFLDNKWIDQYDNILYLDTDTYTWPWAPNIFELCPDDAFSVANLENKLKSKFNNVDIYINKRNKYIDKATRIGLTMDVTSYNLNNFNSGMFVLNRYSHGKINKILTDYPKLLKSFKADQNLLNILCFSKTTDMNLNFLDGKFNHKARSNVKLAKDCYITHLYGGKKKDEEFCINWNNYAKKCIDNYKELQ